MLVYVLWQVLRKALIQHLQALIVRSLHSRPACGRAFHAWIFMHGCTMTI
jgi:hypothetical protein